MYVLLIRFNLKLGFLIFNNMLNDFIDLFLCVCFIRVIGIVRYFLN